METNSLTPLQKLLMKQWERLMALSRAYRTDPAFRARCEEDPGAVLAEEGVDLPPGMKSGSWRTPRTPSMSPCRWIRTPL